MRVKIAYLGPKGTFTEEALDKYISDIKSEDEIEKIPYATMQEVMKSVDRGEAVEGIVPIENSLEGSVNITLDFLTFESEAKIIREITIPIKHSLAKGLITQRVIELISSWAHSGFGAYCGKRIYPKEARSTENLARYVIRASFSQERMKYYPDQAKVTYQSKYGKKLKEFSSLEWMAALVSHNRIGEGRPSVIMATIVTSHGAG